MSAPSPACGTKAAQPGRICGCASPACCSAAALIVWVRSKPTWIGPPRLACLRRNASLPHLPRRGQLRRLGAVGLRDHEAAGLRHVEDAAIRDDGAEAFAGVNRGAGRDELAVLRK